MIYFLVDIDIRTECDFCSGGARDFAFNSLHYQGS